MNLRCYLLVLYISYLTLFCNISELFLSFDIHTMEVHQNLSGKSTDDMNIT